MACERRLAPALLLLTILFAGTAVESQQTPNEPGSSGEPTPEHPVRVRVSQGVSQNLITKRVKADYPKEARKKRIQGLVVLKILISREGEVTQAAVVSGHPMLAPAAVEAVKQWKFKPYLLQGQPVEVETTIQINFTLAGG